MLLDLIIKLQWLFNDLQLNLPSSLLPAIDISYIQEKYAVGNAPSSVKNNNGDSSQQQLINDTLKVHSSCQPC